MLSRVIVKTEQSMNLDKTRLRKDLTNNDSMKSIKPCTPCVIGKHSRGDKMKSLLELVIKGILVLVYVIFYNTVISYAKVYITNDI